MVSLLMISIAGQGFNAAGTVLNGFDLGPNYIGPVSGMVAGVSTTSSLMAPYIVGLLTPHVRGNLPIPHLFRKLFNILNCLSTGILIGMASSILADIYFAHFKDGNIHNLGLGKSSTMELTSNMHKKCLLIPSDMYLFILIIKISQ